MAIREFKFRISYETFIGHEKGRSVWVKKRATVLSTSISAAIKEIRKKHKARNIYVYDENWDDGRRIK